MEKNKTAEKAPSRLGRGLSALIPPSAAVLPAAPPSLASAASATPLSPEGVQEIALADISTNPHQPRTVFLRVGCVRLLGGSRRAVRPLGAPDLGSGRRAGVP